VSVNQKSEYLIAGAWSGMVGTGLRMIIRIIIYFD
jgi:hypothetical protein